MSDTELKLKFWRGGQATSERLAAAVLHLEGFSSVDPQCPLGGPDGLKDVLCEKNDWRYTAAAFFPTTEQTFSAISAKFRHDLAGVRTNGVDGIVFITNQPLTPGGRETLVVAAAAEGHKAIIYHLERLRALLDSPIGYGVRLEFLQVPLSLEEQLSFFSNRDASVTDALRQHTAAVIAAFDRRFDALEGLGNVSLSYPRPTGVQALQTLAAGRPTAPPSDKRRPAVISA